MIPEDPTEADFKTLVLAMEDDELVSYIWLTSFDEKHPFQYPAWRIMHGLVMNGYVAPLKFTVSASQKYHRLTKTHLNQISNWLLMTVSCERVKQYLL
jgi:hypothetical protein